MFSIITFFVILTALVGAVGFAIATKDLGNCFKRCSRIQWRRANSRLRAEFLRGPHAAAQEFRLQDS